MKRDLIALVGVFLLLVGILCGCVPKEEDKPMLTVSIPPQKYLLEQIVGDKYAVNSLLSAGLDPETYDPSVSHLTALQKSDAYFRVGTIGFEQATIEKISENFPSLPIVNTSEGIEAIYGLHGHDHEGHAEVDPHVWSSLKNARVMASNMYEEVVKLNPENKEYYTRRYEKLQNELLQAEDSIRTMLAHKQNPTIAIWHPSLSYFAHDYGVRQIAVETDGKDTTPRRLRETIDTLKVSNPDVFILEEGHDPKQSITVAKSLGIPMVTVGLMDENFVEQLLKIADALSR